MAIDLNARERQEKERWAYLHKITGYANLMSKSTQACVRQGDKAAIGVSQQRQNAQCAQNEKMRMQKTQMRQFAFARA